MNQLNNPRLDAKYTTLAHNICMYYICLDDLECIVLNNIVLSYSLRGEIKYYFQNMRTTQKITQNCELFAKKSS